MTQAESAEIAESPVTVYEDPIREDREKMG